MVLQDIIVGIQEIQPIIQVIRRRIRQRNGFSCCHGMLVHPIIQLLISLMLLYQTVVSING